MSITTNRQPSNTRETTSSRAIEMTKPEPAPIMEIFKSLMGILQESRNYIFKGAIGISGPAAEPVSLTLG